MSRNFEVRVSTRPCHVYLHASLLRKSPEVLCGDEALCGTMDADENQRAFCTHARLSPSRLLRNHSNIFAYFTKTHVGFKGGKAIRPIAAVAATRTGLLTFQRNSTTRLTSPISAVSQSPMWSFPRSLQSNFSAFRLTPLEWPGLPPSDP